MSKPKIEKDVKNLSEDGEVQSATAAVQSTAIRWDDSQMVTAFANVINIINTREEFSLLFGTNQTWNPGSTSELVVQLANRIVLTPFAAKRLQVLLNERLNEYEVRYGPLDLGK